MYIPFADGHCDFLYGMVNWGYDMNRPAKRQAVGLEALKAGNVKLQTFAAWIDVTLKRSALSQVIAMADAYERLLEENRVFVRLSPDFDTEDEHIATVLTIEGGEAAEEYLENLRCFRRMGFVAMTLTWNTPNKLAYPAVLKGKKGLTALGREMIREMARLGMAVDVSHLGDYGIDGVLEEDVKVFASHSNARAVFNTPRSICDEHIREIARRGGTVGVNFYNKQLCKGAATVPIIADHIMHIVDVGGVSCAAIGSDFDGMTAYPEGLGTPAGLPLIAKELCLRGLDDETVRRVCCDNLLGFMKGVCAQ